MIGIEQQGERVLAGTILCAMLVLALALFGQAGW